MRLNRAYTMQSLWHDLNLKILNTITSFPVEFPVLDEQQRNQLFITAHFIPGNSGQYNALTHWGRDKMDAIFTDDIFKCIFLNENARISLEISLKFVPKVRINNIPALVRIMAWRRPGDKPLSEPMMVSLPTHICVTRPQWVNSLWPGSVVRLYGIVELCRHYRQTSNISSTKSQNLNVSHLVLQLSLPNPLKPGVKSRMKM